MSNKQIRRKLVFDAQGEDATSIAYRVTDYNRIAAMIGAASTPTLSVKVKISNGIIADGDESSTAPDFSAAATTANPWSYAELVPLIGGTALGGATGVAFTGTAGVGHYAVNVDNTDWIAFEVSGHSAGTATVNFSAQNNE